MLLVVVIVVVVVVAVVVVVVVVVVIVDVAIVVVVVIVRRVCVFVCTCLFSFVSRFPPISSLFQSTNQLPDRQTNQSINQSIHCAIAIH